MEEIRAKFSSKVTALLAIIMTSWGLGNIWRFPYLTAKYGGASFVVAYIITVLLVVIIGNQVEAALGKYTRRGVVGAFTAVGKSKFWRFCGWVILWSNVVVMVYYNNVVGWVWRYFATSFSGAVFHAASTEAFFKSFIDTPQVVIWTLVVNIVVFGVIWFGVNNGLEKISSIMGPILFLLVVLLIIRTLFLPNVAAGINFYLTPKWEYLGKVETWVQAIGQALWSGCFGQGIMLAMGSYMKKDDDIGKSFFVGGMCDAATSWMAGFAIIPATVAFGIPLASGSSLSFLTLPKMFSTMAGGQLIMIIFFGALAIAGLCASIGCIEAIVTPLLDEWKYNRRTIVLLMFLFFNIAAIPTSLSKNVQDWLDVSLGTFAYPVCGALILIFAGWVFGAKKLREKVMNADADIKIGAWWDVMVKYVSPMILILSAVGFAKVWLIPSVTPAVATGILVPCVVFFLLVLFKVFYGSSRSGGSAVEKEGI